MNSHAGFIVAAYAISGFVIAVTIASLWIDYSKLRHALAKFPARESAEDTA